MLADWIRERYWNVNSSVNRIKEDGQSLPVSPLFSSKTSEDKSIEDRRCELQIENEDLPDAYGGWCCLRDTWEDYDYCIWHADRNRKPIKQLRSALKDEIGRFAQTAQSRPRLDYAKLSNLEIPEPDYESIEGPVGPGLQFGRVTLIGADFRSSELRACSFDSAIAHFADFEHADLTYRLFQGAELTGASFKYATLKGVNTHHATLRDVDFTGADLTEANLVFSDAQGANFRHADLDETYMHDVNLQDSILEDATLNQTDLTGANLVGTRLHKAIVRDIRIDETTELGGICWYERTADNAVTSKLNINSENERWTNRLSLYEPLARFLGRIQGMPVVDEEVSTLNKAIRVYRLYQRILTENSLPGSVRRFRIRERHARRKRALEEGGYLEWVSLALQRWTILYGEGPGRIVGVSVASILFFAIVYPLWGVNIGSQVIRYDSTPLLEAILTSLYFSAVTFSTLGYGDVQPLGASRGIAAFEALLGAVLIALLVFVLGRRTAW